MATKQQMTELSFLGVLIGVTVMITNPVTKPLSKALGCGVDIEFFLILADLKSFVDSFYSLNQMLPTRKALAIIVRDGFTAALDEAAVNDVEIIHIMSPAVRSSTEV